jgi:hypothetical protein
VALNRTERKLIIHRFILSLLLTLIGSGVVGSHFDTLLSF